MTKNRVDSWDRRRLGELGQALFGDGSRVSGRRKPHVVTWLKKKRTPRKQNTGNMANFFKKKRTPRQKRINIDLLRLFSVNLAVPDSNRVEEIVEDCDLLFCTKNKRTPVSDKFGFIVSKAPRSALSKVSSLINSIRPLEKVEGGCDLVRISPLDNQDALSPEGFVAKNEGHFSPVQSQVFHQDSNPLPYQEKSMDSLVYAQGKEINPDDSKSDDFPQDVIENNETVSYPKDVRSLLARGILENFLVKYKKKKVEIFGYIRGCKYLCGCSSCNFTQVLTALEFEKHAGMSSHNQNNSIYLCCGTKISIYNLVNQLKNTPPRKPFEVLVEEIIQFPPNLECYREWKASQNRREAAVGHLSVDTSTNLSTLQQPSGNTTYLSQDASVMFINDRSDHIASHINDSTVQGIEGATNEIDAMECSSAQPADEGNVDPNQSIAAKINFSTSGMENSNNAASLVPIELNYSRLSSECSADLEPKFHILPATEGTNHISSGHSVELSSLEPAIDNGNGGTPSACSNLTSEMPDMEDLPSEILADVALARQSEKLSAADSQSKLDKSTSDQFPAKPVSQDLCYSTKSDNKNLHPMVFPKGVSKKRDSNLHQLVFMENGLPNGSKLTYVDKEQKLKTGYKQGNCIVCDCCGKEMRPSQFEAHAGCSHRRQPYRHIYTSTSETLHALSLRLAAAHALSTSSSQAFCTLCGNGVRLGGQYLGDGKWHCFLCKHNRVSRAAFRTVSADVPRGIAEKAQLLESHHAVSKSRAVSAKKSRDTAESTKLHIIHHLVAKAKAKAVSTKTSRVGAKLAKFPVSRILVYQTDEFLCCSFCKDSYFSVESFDEKTEIFCKQCEREYHIGCLKEYGVCDLKEIPQCSEWLCSADCISVHDYMQTLSNMTSQVIPQSLLKRGRIDVTWKYLAKDIGADMQWQILSGTNLKNKLLLDMAIAFFQKASNRILDRGQDLTNDMVYAKDVAGRSFGGMYCPVITLKSDIVSAGLLRVFGRCVAEIPLVATLQRFRRKGYFRVLLLVIEGLLNKLEVDYLIVSVPKDSQAPWIEKLGFVPVTEDRLQSYLKNHPILIFENSVILEKKIYLEN